MVMNNTIVTLVVPAKQPTFDFKSTSDMQLCCLSSFIMIAS